MAIVRLDLQKKAVIREVVEIAMQRNRRGGGGRKQKRGRWMETEEGEVDENRSG